MNIQEVLAVKVKEAFQSLYNASLDEVEFQATRKDFEGDITVVIFPMLRVKKMNPAQMGEEIGAYLMANVDAVERYNVVKGFLNLVIDDSYYLDFFTEVFKNNYFGHKTPKEGEKAVMVEYSSPNTNKPLHLGHIRNNLLGYSVAEIIKASGKKVYKTQIINDRGIHICKSMLAWQRFGNGETPQSTGLKGDKLVGNYYVVYNNKLKKELKHIFNIAIKEFQEIRDKRKINSSVLRSIDKELKINLIAEAYNRALYKYLYYKREINDYSKILNESYSTRKLLEENPLSFNSYDKAKAKFSAQNINVLNFIENKKIEFPNKNSKKIFGILKKELELIAPIHQEAQEMLRQWEAGNPEVVALWEQMNQWVYDGFAETYVNLGVDFDALYYESDTYLLGKDFVEEGLEKGVFYKKEDGSVWCDLTDEGLDEKIVLRADGTAVYMTQDIGTAIQRVKDYPDVGGMIYTVGNEQDYHFKVLFLILKKLGFDWSKNLYHLSYGMVDLPSGKMKSREGTVVDADDLMVEMAATAKEISQELGKLDGYSETEKEALYKIIGMGALKYFILKIDPKKRILFDPKESIDFAGNTGPFIQYTYARIQSILRKADFDYSKEIGGIELDIREKEILKQLQGYPDTVQLAANNQSPAIIANYTYDLVKLYNSFFQNIYILGEEDEDKKIFRVQLSKKVGDTIKLAFGLLGIEVPERM
ncbi:arginine--tRNA ligase [Kordia zhangzhouensis]|uniref:arginine--tRNA ligase n=1 Tax=Kordia zhangzhouensis TaxID=1620405 RepID=UPI0006296E36|nr:arginine--tRNA ligase [Kordia zhangzhouensis]